jgi:biotin carboxyl carrier protein
MAEDHIITAPLPGVFYRRPEPEADVCVEIGQHIEAGTTVGLIEVMKSFFPVEADVAGTVSRFLVEDGDFIDSGQDLVVVETRDA